MGHEFCRHRVTDKVAERMHASLDRFLSLADNFLIRFLPHLG